MLDKYFYYILLKTSTLQFSLLCKCCYIKCLLFVYPVTINYLVFRTITQSGLRAWIFLVLWFISWRTFNKLRLTVSCIEQTNISLIDIDITFIFLYKYLPLFPFPYLRIINTISLRTKNIGLYYASLYSFEIIFDKTYKIVLLDSSFSLSLSEMV